MSIWIVRASINLKTPSGGINKRVNWSHYEAKAHLVTSTSASEAFNRFLINTQRIINASKNELQYMDSIYFYEATPSSKNNEMKHGPRLPTSTIKVEEDMKLEIMK